MQTIYQSKLEYLAYDGYDTLCKQKEKRSIKRRVMKHRGLLLVFAMNLLMISPLTFGTQQTVMNTEIPDLDDDTSMEEEDLLDTFQAEDPSVFMQWVNKISTTLVARCIIIKRAMQTKYFQIRDWWKERKTTKKQKKEILV